MKITGPIPNHILEKMPRADRPAGKAGMTAAECQEKIELKSEKELQRQCANYLRQRDIWFAQSRMDRKTSNKVGTPDFLFAHNHVPIAVECKHGAEKLSDEQEAAFAKMTLNGWKCFTVRSTIQLMDVVNYGEIKERAI
jgi:hypothetical protein